MLTKIIYLKNQAKFSGYKAAAAAEVEAAAAAEQLHPETFTKK